MANEPSLEQHYKMDSKLLLDVALIMLLDRGSSTLLMVVRHITNLFELAIDQSVLRRPDVFFDFKRNFCT